MLIANITLFAELTRLLHPIPARKAALQHGAKRFSTRRVLFANKMCPCTDKNTYFYAQKGKCPSDYHREIPSSLRSG